jgi:hypothetical protein
MGIGNTELLLLRQGLFGEARDFYLVTTLKTYSKNGDISPEQND